MIYSTWRDIHPDTRTHMGEWISGLKRIYFFFAINEILCLLLMLVLPHLLRKIPSPDLLAVCLEELLWDCDWWPLVLWLRFSHLSLDIPIGCFRLLGLVSDSSLTLYLRAFITITKSEPLTEKWQRTKGQWKEVKWDTNKTWLGQLRGPSVPEGPVEFFCKQTDVMLSSLFTHQKTHCV